MTVREIYEFLHNIRPFHIASDGVIRSISCLKENITIKISCVMKMFCDKLELNHSNVKMYFKIKRSKGR